MLCRVHAFAQFIFRIEFPMASAIYDLLDRYIFLWRIYIYIWLTRIESKELFVYVFLWPAACAFGNNDIFQLWKHIFIMIKWKFDSLLNWWSQSKIIKLIIWCVRWATTRMYIHWMNFRFHWIRHVSVVAGKKKHMFIFEFKTDFYQWLMNNHDNDFEQKPFKHRFPCHFNRRSTMHVWWGVDKTHIFIYSYLMLTDENMIPIIIIIIHIM